MFNPLLSRLFNRFLLYPVINHNQWISEFSNFAPVIIRYVDPFQQKKILTSLSCSPTSKNHSKKYYVVSVLNVSQFIKRHALVILNERLRYIFFFLSHRYISINWLYKSNSIYFWSQFWGQFSCSIFMF